MIGPYTAGAWVDDDGSGTTGTTMSAGLMNNMESGLVDASLRTRVVRVAGAVPVPVGPLSDVRSIDGILLADGDRVLLVGQALPADNGIYISFFLSGRRTLTRDADFSVGTDVKAGQAIFVLQGTCAGRTFVVTGDAPNIGVTAINIAGDGSRSFSAWLNNVATSLASGVLVPFGTTEWDTTGAFDTVNKRFTPTQAGIYEFSWCLISGAVLILDVYWTSWLRKNGANYRLGSIVFQRGASAGPASIGTALVQMNGTTDFVDIITSHVQGGSVALNTSPATFFQGKYLGRG